MQPMVNSTAPEACTNVGCCRVAVNKGRMIDIRYWNNVFYFSVPSYSPPL